MEEVMNRTILYIDDDDDDRLMVREAIAQLDGGLRLVESPGGAEGLAYLQRTAANGGLPCLVLLDLNMPGMNGRDTLLAIRGTDQLAALPVIVFTTSSSELDKTFCRKYGVEMITKPFSFQNLMAVMESILCRC